MNCQNLPTDTMIRSAVFYFFLLAVAMTAVLGIRPKSQYSILERDTCKTKQNGSDVGQMEFTDCFQGLCSCAQTTANCSGNIGALTFVPELPSEISFLNFSNNGLTKISRDFFDNVTHLEAVDLSFNPLVHIHRQAFENLTQLKVLIMTDCYNLTKKQIKPIFQATSLTCIDMHSGSIKTLPRPVFFNTHMPSLRALDLHDNDIDVVDLKQYQRVADFGALLFGANNIHTVYKPGSPMRSLEKIELVRNRLNKFPETCSENSTSLFPALEVLYLKKNKLTQIPSKICLPELRTMSLGGNFFPVLYQDMFSAFPKLNSLYLNYVDTQIERIEPFAFRHPTLAKLALEYNKIDFSFKDKYSPEAFAGCPNLIELNLTSNVLTEVSDDHFVHMIGKITTLEKLALGGAGFHRITTDTFAQLRRLEKLYLYKNKIAQIPEGAFKNNVKLHTIWIDRNRISNINGKTFSEDLRRRLRWFDASGNPFVCDCDLRWFSQWLRTHGAMLGSQWTDYNCSNLPQSVDSFTMQAQACLLRYTETVNIITSISVITFLFVSFVLLFACKWQIRLRLYEVFRGPADVRRHALMTGKFRYDVFVSYTSEDQRWVTQHLMPELEGRMKFKLCIHERDFIPGKHIVDNIVQCLESSKKVLVVFSKHFLASSWCQFELAVCLQHVLDCDDSLLVVCLGDVASRQMTSAMEAVMKTMTYIQWERGSERCARMRSAFWHRIGRALKEASISSSL